MLFTLVITIIAIIIAIIVIPRRSRYFILKDLVFKEHDYCDSWDLIPSH